MSIATISIESEASQGIKKQLVIGRRVRLQTFCQGGIQTDKSAKDW